MWTKAMEAAKRKEKRKRWPCSLKRPSAVSTFVLKNKTDAEWSASHPIMPRAASTPAPLLQEKKGGPYSGGQIRQSCENERCSGEGWIASFSRFPFPARFCLAAEWQHILSRTDSTRKNNFLEPNYTLQGLRNANLVSELLYPK